VPFRTEHTNRLGDDCSDIFIAEACAKLEVGLVGLAFGHARQIEAARALEMFDESKDRFNAALKKSRYIGRMRTARPERRPRRKPNQATAVVIPHGGQQSLITKTRPPRRVFLLEQRMPIAGRVSNPGPSPLVGPGTTLRIILSDGVFFRLIPACGRVFR
jgi:hypothetical protein